MTDAVVVPVDNPRRFHFDWVPILLFRPRQAFARISAQNSSVWLTPLLILSIAVLLQVMATGWVKQTSVAMGQVELPPDFQYYSPEQQAQYQQAIEATSGPVFLYVFPAIVGLMGVWLGWLIVAGLMHLVLTLLGGRGDTGGAMNIVAWAGLPFALRELVRFGAVLASKKVIASPGLSGFVTPTGDWNLYLAAFLALVDIYVIWHIVLLLIGVRASNGLSPAKAAAAVLFTVVLVLAVQALIGFLPAKFGGTTVIRPFF